MKFQQFYLVLLAIATLSLGALACKPNGSESAISTPPKPELDPQNARPTERKPGNYCFKLKDSNLSMTGNLTYAPNSTVEGTLRGTVVDADNGMESVFNTSFQGELHKDTLDLSVLSDESGSRTNGREKWMWKDSTLVTGTRILRQSACQ